MAICPNHLVEEADIYLWNEPANYLDVFNQDQLINMLKKNNRQYCY